MRDYGKVHSSFWTSDNIRAMSEDGRALALYLLTCQHGTIAGVFRLPDGYVCEDIQWNAERVSETLCELFANGFATRCEHTKWVFVHKHLEWNPPENPNQKKAAAKMALQVPDSCCWKAEFIGRFGVFLGLVEENKTQPIEPLPNPLATLPQPVTVTVTEVIPSLSDSANPTNAVNQDPNSKKPESKTPAIPPCPFEDLIDAYESALPNLPSVTRSLFRDGVNGKATAQRWGWVMVANHEKGKKKGQRLAVTQQEGIDWFIRFFNYAAGSDFLTGANGKFTGCSMGWLMTKSNFEKVLGGNYHMEIAA